MPLPDTFMCPICGYPGLYGPAYSPRTHLGSYEICPSCWFEYGVTDDDKGFTHQQWRAGWIADGMPWRSPVDAQPPGWDPREQLRRLTG
ncbi:hypothetical protein [Pseudonocardia sp. GCM10023141]|uniref:hypothetical protein n=1 Tax=Pseudonocardia sp. GCM10023141 TaxID=3252653 RepID=UPI003606FACD